MRFLVIFFRRFFFVRVATSFGEAIRPLAGALVVAETSVGPGVFAASDVAADPVLCRVAFPFGIVGEARAGGELREDVDEIGICEL